MSRVGIVVLCYGNICRSPMAEGLLKKELGDRGLAERYAVSSAGFLGDGHPAHPNAVAAMEGRGIRIFDHQSRLLTPEIVAENLLILAMEEKLAARARDLGAVHAYNLVPYATLGAEVGDIADPLGQDLAGFEACARRLELLIPLAVDRLVKERF